MAYSDILEKLFVSLSRTAVAKLKLAATEEDPEKKNLAADEAIIELLDELGYERVVETWKEVKAKK